MNTIAIINGPNLDRLGIREPEIYGRETLADLEAMLRKRAEAGPEQADLHFFQSNHEGEIIDRIASCSDNGFVGIIINPGAYTHTSIAIYDALAGAGIRCVEVHISNIYKREDFRNRSFTGAACEGVVTGLGLFGYLTALEFLLHGPGKT